MSFFDRRSDVSAVKARIVAKYFSTWAKVIAPTAKKFSGKVGYIDLFAGPGRYRDGSASTPLLILNTAIHDPQLSQMLVSLFNDQDIDHSSTLRKEIQLLQNVDTLKFKPDVRTAEIGDTIADFLGTITLIPSFTFVDPFGYKGLSLKIVNAVVKDWGCDCVFFFNYMRINLGISNPKVSSHLNALFGEMRANKLRSELKGRSPAERECLILNFLKCAVRSLGAKHVLPFSFKNQSGTRTSHYLIFVSKSFKGEEIMKTIMASESTSFAQGVPSFEYSHCESRQPHLPLSAPLDDLALDLRNRFAGQCLSFRRIYESHSVGTKFIRRNYVATLIRLENEGQITCSPAIRRKGTLADHVIIQFT